MTRIEGIRNAAANLLLTKTGTKAELDAARILKQKLVYCSLLSLDGDEYARAILAQLDDSCTAPNSIL